LVQREYLNARSPLRLLEKSLDGGLGAGNIGVVLGGRGVGKTAVLLGFALDEMLRGGRVLHVCVDQSVAHVRAHYDTVFEDFASAAHLENEAAVHLEVDRRRSIRVYPPDTLSSAKLREAVELEVGAGAKPSLLIIEGVDCGNLPNDEMADLKALAGEIAAEVWISAGTNDEGAAEVPAAIERFGDLVSVVLTLEPADDAVALRALKGHDNPDLEALHVSLDPRTLLLIRS
jgi:hypothetical protein